VNLNTAQKLINQYLADMATRCGAAAFDEWAIIDTHAEPRLLAYNGPRESSFLEVWRDDMMPLRQRTQNRELMPGEFELATNAPGLAHDVVICIGSSRYLVLNQTNGSVFGSPAWPHLEPLLFLLIARFRAVPVL
jgi:hypothetical protein